MSRPSTCIQGKHVKEDLHRNTTVKQPLKVYLWKASSRGSCLFRNTCRELAPHMHCWKMEAHSTRGIDSKLVQRRFLPYLWAGLCSMQNASIPVYKASNSFCKVSAGELLIQFLSYVSCNISSYLIVAQRVLAEKNLCKPLNSVTYFWARQHSHWWEFLRQIY